MNRIKALIIIISIACGVIHGGEYSSWEDISTETKWEVSNSYLHYGVSYITDDLEWILFRSADKKRDEEGSYRRYVAGGYEFHDVKNKKMMWKLNEIERPMSSVIDIIDNQNLQSPATPTQPITGVLIDPENNIVWTAHSDGHIYRRNFKTGIIENSAQVLPNKPRKEISISLNWCVKGKSIAVTSRNTWYYRDPANATSSFHTKFVIFDTNTMKITDDMNFPTNESVGFYFTQKRGHILYWFFNSDSKMKRIKLYDLRSKKIIKTYDTLNKYSLCHASISKDQDVLIGDVGGTAHVWDLQTSNLLYTIHGHLLEVVEIAQKRFLVFNDFNKHSVSIYSLKSGKFLYHLNLGVSKDVFPMRSSTAATGNYTLICDSPDNVTMFDHSIRKRIYNYRTPTHWELNNAVWHKSKPLFSISEREPISDATPFMRTILLKKKN